jgi:hypothetical protein
LREAGSGPVVTFGVTRSAAVTGLFMAISLRDQRARKTADAIRL